MALNAAEIGNRSSVTERLGWESQSVATGSSSLRDQALASLRLRRIVLFER